MDNNYFTECNGCYTEWNKYTNSTSKPNGKCSKCKGTGRFNFGDDDYTKWDTCNRCKGTGVCPGCNGSGVISAKLNQ